ncbi:MAG: hypothetical protein J2P28_02985 [Actinobacteria bacterium]|nr:hypothetical protein [Actinomycetota bacterium]MBO0834469.1 hypothetical protein [Actinomycetota bacterium]
MHLAMGRWKIVLTAVAALGALAIMVSPPANAASQPANAGPSYTLWDNYGPDGGGGATFSLHASAHDYPIVTCHRGCVAQVWTKANCENHTFWNGSIYQVCDIKLSGTNECANYYPSVNGLWLDSCVANDANEEFIWNPVGGTIYGTVYNFINYQASDNARAYEYMQATALEEGALIVFDKYEDCLGCAYWEYIGPQVVSPAA